MASCYSSVQCGYGLFCIYEPSSNQNFCECTEDRYWDLTSYYCGNLMGLIVLEIISWESDSNLLIFIAQITNNEY